MLSDPPQDGVPFIVHYKDQPVRCVMSEGSPWFEAATVCTLLNLSLSTITDFDATALDTDIAQHLFDDEATAVLSPIGVWRLSLLARKPIGPKVSSWAKREAAVLVPTPDTADARLFLTLNANGTRPPYPDRFSGRLDEWKELLFHPLHKSDDQIRMTARYAALQQSWDRRMAAEGAPEQVPRPSNILSPLPFLPSQPKN